MKQPLGTCKPVSLIPAVSKLRAKLLLKGLKHTESMKVQFHTVSFDLQINTRFNQMYKVTVIVEKGRFILWPS